MANPDLSKQLDDLLKTATVPAGAGAPATPTEAFGGAAPKGGHARSAASKEESARRMTLRNMFASRAVQADSVPGRIRIKFSEMARVCGYTCGTNEKFDFAKKKESTPGSDEYTLFVKMTPPSKVDGVIVRYPLTAWQELNRSNPDAMNLAAADDPNQQFTTTIIPADSIINWMQQNTAGYLLEAEEIFEPVIRKAGKNVISIQTPADVPPSKKGNGVPAKPAIYVDVAGTLKKKENGETTRPKLRLKSNYRTKLVTPHNYIAKRKFVTMPVKTSYSPDEIATYIRAYFERYYGGVTKTNKTIESVFAHLSGAALAYFHPMVNDKGKHVLDSTEYFTGDASASAWNTITVKHWFQKNDRGEAIEIPGTQVALAVREFVKDGDAEKPAAFRKTMIQDPAKAQPGAYVLDVNGEHAKIAAACKGGLTFEMLDRFYTESASTSRKTTGSGLGSGMAIMGLTESALNDILAQFMG